MKILIKSALILCVTILSISCSSDDDETKKTNATITLLQDGQPVEGVTVYVYDDINWDMFGDDESFALGSSVSNGDGKAKFNNLEYPTVFTQLNNNTNVMTFSAHYIQNGVEKTKTTSITIAKGQSKSAELNLN